MVVCHAHLQPLFKYSWETVLLSSCCFSGFSFLRCRIFCVCIMNSGSVYMGAGLRRVPLSLWLPSWDQHDLHSGSGADVAKQLQGLQSPPSHPGLWPKKQEVRGTKDQGARGRSKQEQARSARSTQHAARIGKRTPLWQPLPCIPRCPVIFLPVKPYKNCFRSLIGNKFACLAYETKERRREQSRNRQKKKIRKARGLMHSKSSLNWTSQGYIFHRNLEYFPLEPSTLCFSHKSELKVKASFQSRKHNVSRTLKIFANENVLGGLSALSP